MSRRLWLVLVLLIARRVGAQSACIDELNRSTYPSGFSWSDFSWSWAVNINNGDAQLDPSAMWGYVYSLPDGPFNVDAWVTELQFSATGRFDLPCPAPSGNSPISVDANNNIPFWYQLDGTWWPLTFPQSVDPRRGNSGIIDLFSHNLFSRQLNWWTYFNTTVPGCTPTLTATAPNPFQWGYRAVRHGTYQSVDPLPMANVMARARYETPSTVHTAKGFRGKVELLLLYDPSTYQDFTQSGPVYAWNYDAGTTLALFTPPNARRVFTNLGGGNAVALTSIPDPTLDGAVLPPSVRNARWPNSLPHNGTLVYDFNNSGLVDDYDAQWLIEWTRGYLDGTSKNQEREWKLGASLEGTMAFIAPPPDDPWWSGFAIPEIEKQAYSAFVAAHKRRSSLLLAGARDGMIHAFDAGHFDPNTGARGAFYQPKWWDALYGTGAEVWAWVPRAQLSKLKDWPAEVAGYEPVAGQQASMDSGITLLDGYVNGNFQTLVLASETRAHPFVTAINVTDENNPKPLWAEDWPSAAENELDFNGTDRAPTAGPIETNSGRRWEMVVGTGLSKTLRDEYLYFVDLASGTTVNKIKLNNGASPDRGYGLSGSPVLIDSDGDGRIDRAYAADAAVDLSGNMYGRLFKVDTTTMTACVVAVVSDPIFAPIAALQSPVGLANSELQGVRLFFGGADHPLLDDPIASSYNFYEFVDVNRLGVCTSAGPEYFKNRLPSPPESTVTHKLWAAPVVTGDTIYLATAVGQKRELCASDTTTPGRVLAYTFYGNPPLGFVASDVPGGNAVGGITAVDGHLFVNAQNGASHVFGKPTWNSSPKGPITFSTQLMTDNWLEK